MTQIDGVEAGITCGKCGTAYTVPFPGLTPDNLAMTGQESVTVAIPYRCPMCGAEGEMTVTAALSPPD